MPDPARPKAPFLPPEIVHQIIENITPADKSYHLIARINSSWTVDAQAQLFAFVGIGSVERLRLLVPILESQNHLAQIVTTATVFLDSVVWPQHVQQCDPQGTADAADLIFRFFSSATNLKALLFKGASYTFSDEHQAIFFSTPVLPSLVNLKIWPFDPISDYSHFECILATSPTLETLQIRTSQVPGQIADAFEPNWSARSYPRNLKNLFLDQWEPFAEGKLWPLESMVGLVNVRVNELHIERPYKPVDLGLFFKTVGPTLKSFSIIGQIVSTNVSCSDLVVLERLTGLQLKGRPNFLLELSATVKYLSVFGTQDEINSVLTAYENNSVEKHLLFECLELMLFTSEEEEFIINLEYVPTTKNLILTSLLSVQPALDSLEMGKAKFEEIILKRTGYDEEGIEKRCEELGIRLTWFDTTS